MVQTQIDRYRNVINVTVALNLRIRFARLGTGLSACPRLTETEG